MSDLLNSEGKGWFEENKTQMRNFTEQHVKEVLLKATLQPRRQKKRTIKGNTKGHRPEARQAT
jgi:hypothetical protein